MEPSQAVRAVEGFLHRCANLSHLVLKGYPRIQQDENVPLVLENLDTFYFDACDRGDDHLTNTPPSHWVLPKLNRLTLVNCRLSSLRPFLQANGGALDYLGMLCFSPSVDAEEGEEGLLVALLTTCPILRHFCIQEGQLHLLTAHPTICFVDVMVSMHSSAFSTIPVDHQYPRLRILAGFEQHAHLPNWNKCMRWVDGYFISFMDLDCIPLLFPPNTGPSPGETIRHSVFQSTMIETCLELRLAQDEELWPDDGSDVDSTYSYRSRDGNSEYSDNSEYWPDSNASESERSQSRLSSVSQDSLLGMFPTEQMLMNDRLIPVTESREHGRSVDIPQDPRGGHVAVAPM